MLNLTNKPDIRWRRLFLAVIASIIVFYLWLMASVPMRAITHAGYDDAWFIKMAARILAGQWLGPYNSMTLIKGPVFSIWLAVNWFIGLPILVSQAILYGGAGMLLLSAFWDRFPKKWVLILVFGYYLFNPVVYSLSLLRVVREGLYVPLTVMLVAVLAWNYRVMNHKTQVRLAWAAVLGIVGGLYWSTREEGLWILPAYIVGCLGLLLAQWKSQSSQSNDHHVLSFIKREVRYPAVSILCAWLVIEGFSLVNLAHYGTSDIVEFKQPEFLAAYGALNRVDQAPWKRYVPLPKIAWPVIAQVSPKFHEIEPLLDQPWAVTAGCDAHHVVPCDGEIRAGWFMWAFRKAVDDAGYYRSAQYAKEYYRALATEVNLACSEGKLHCFPQRQTMTPPFRLEYIKDTWDALLRAVSYVSLLSGVDVRPMVSAGPVQYYFSFSSDMTHSTFFPLSTKDTFLMTLTTSGSGPISATVVGLAQDQVYGMVNLYNMVKQPNGDLSAEVEISTDCLDKGCALEFREAGHLIGTVAISELKPGTEFQMKTGHLRINKVFYSDSGTYLPSLTRSQAILKILKSIAKVYQILFPFMLVISILIFLVQFAVSIRRRFMSPLFWLNCVLLTLIITRLLLLSYLDANSMVPAINILYLSPVYPLVLLFSCFVLSDCYSFKKSNFFS